MADSRHARIPRGRVRKGRGDSGPFRWVAASMDRGFKQCPRRWGRPVQQAWQFAEPHPVCKHRLGRVRYWHGHHKTNGTGAYFKVRYYKGRWRHVEYEWWWWTGYHTGDLWLLA